MRSILGDESLGQKCRGRDGAGKARPQPVALNQALACLALADQPIGGGSAKGGVGSESRVRAEPPREREWEFAWRGCLDLFNGAVGRAFLHVNQKQGAILSDD